MKKILIALALITSTVANAQIADDKNQFNHLSLGVNMGTNGIGFELGTTITPIIAVRAGMDFMPQFNINTNIDYDRPEVLNKVPQQLLEERYVNIPEHGAQAKFKIRPFMTQGKLLFDIYTSKNSMFHFTIGAYFGSSTIAKGRCAEKAIAAIELYNQDIKNGLIEPEDGYEDGFHIDMEGYKIGTNQGRAQLYAKVNSVRPYIGIGVGRTVPRHRFGCKFDFGVQFWGKPRLYDKYNNDHEITKSEPGISKDFKDGLDIANKVTVYPTLKFSVFGRIL